MLVEILKDVFQSSIHDNTLDELYFEFGHKHKLLIRDDEDIEAIMESNWFKGLKELYQKSIYESVVWSIHNSNKTPNCIISQNTDDAFSPYEALKYLQQQFVILIENRYNDAPFVDCLIKHFPPKENKIVIYKSEKWLRYGMGGGTSIEQEIKAELESFENDIFTKEKWKYLRYFVILDSDRRYPKMPFSNDKLRIIKLLEDNKIPYHILEKREMENYLPNDCFQEINDPIDFVEAYLELDDKKQKDYFDLQYGFKKKYDDLEEEVKELFEGITGNQKTIFRNYSLEKINGSEKDNFKSEFPKLFLSENVTADKLLERCSHHSNEANDHPFDKMELPNLIKKINDLL